MAYVTRKGIRINIPIILMSSLLLLLLYIYSDWESQFGVLQQYEMVSEPYISPKITILVFYFLLAFFVATSWYLFGKYLSPLFSSYLSTFFGGLASTTFIDVNINQADMRFFKFVGLSINSVLIIFSIDLFLSNSIFYVSGNLPTFTSFVIAIAVLTLFQPFHLVYDGIGVRAYNKGNAEVIGISSFLDRIVFRLLSTGGLLGVFASISVNAEIFDQIPAAIRISFVRSTSIGLMIMVLYHILYQPKGIISEWKSRNISAGRTKVETL